MKLKKYIVRYNVGCGDMYDEIDAPNAGAANDIAYEMWREAAEAEADFDALPWTQELADDLL